MLEYQENAQNAINKIEKAYEESRGTNLTKEECRALMITILG